MILKCVKKKTSPSTLSYLTPAPRLHPEAATRYYFCFSLLVNNIYILFCDPNELLCTLPIDSIPITAEPPQQCTRITFPSL